MTINPLNLLDRDGIECAFACWGRRPTPNRHPSGTGCGARAGGSNLALKKTAPRQAVNSDGC